MSTIAKSSNTKRLIVLKDKIDDSSFKAYGQLVLTLSHLEWFLQQVLIYLVLRTQLDKSNNSHAVLTDYISRLSFDKKIELTKRHGLLDSSLMSKLDIIRKRRNVFIHGVVIKEADHLVIKLFDKKLQENFDSKNISEFLNYTELTGGELVSAFESQGFKLQQ
jgi:hypothetical protein